MSPHRTVHGRIDFDQGCSPSTNTNSAGQHRVEILGKYLGVNVIYDFDACGYGQSDLTSIITIVYLVVVKGAEVKNDLQISSSLSSHFNHNSSVYESALDAISKRKSERD